MSTILDALRKVERDRPQTRREQLLELPRRHGQRRPLSLTLIGSFAALGFAAGIALALWRNARPLELASIPSTLPARPIDAPAPAARPNAPARAARHMPPAASGPAAPAAPAAPSAAENGAGAAGAPPADAASAGATGAAAPVPPPDAGAASAPASAPPAQVAAAEPAAPVPPPLAVSPQTAGAEQPVGGGAVAPPNQAAPDAAGSALEPSPFARAGAAPPRARPAARLPAPEGVAEPPPDALAALVPAPLAPAPASDLPAAEPEPAPPAPSPEVVIDTGRSPAGAPRLALTFLQWSNDPEHRFAFISVEGAPGQRVREGDTMAGMTVAQITPTGVQFRREGKLFTIRPRH